MVSGGSEGETGAALEAGGQDTLSTSEAVNRTPASVLGRGMETVLGLSLTLKKRLHKKRAPGPGCVVWMAAEVGPPRPCGGTQMAGSHERLLQEGRCLSSPMPCGGPIPLHIIS